MKFKQVKMLSFISGLILIASPPPAYAITFHGPKQKRTKKEALMRETYKQSCLSLFVGAPSTKNLILPEKIAADFDRFSDRFFIQGHLRAYDINAQLQSTGNTLLHEAVHTKNERVIQLAIEHGASPYIPNKRGKRVIELKFFQEFIKKLAEAEPDSSKTIYNVYLAGPEVFLKYDRAAGDFLKAQITLFNRLHLEYSPYNIKGLFPLDAQYIPENTDLQDAINIFHADVGLMDASQVILANTVRFRGPGMDTGTAFEIGYMAAQGKTLIAYYDEAPFYAFPRPNRLYTEKAEELTGKLSIGGPFKNWLYDKDGLMVERFPLPENLMISVPVMDEGRRAMSNSSWEALEVLKEALDKAQAAKSKNRAD